MSTPMNRRAWLKAASLVTGGLALVPAGLNHLSANPYVPSPRRVSDFAIGGEAQPVLKARLFANENPFGPSEKAKQAIVEALGSCYQYPMRGIEELAGKIAAYEGVDEKMVILGAGSSSLLAGFALKASIGGGNIVSADPSYDDLLERAEQLKLKWVKVPLTAEYKLDLDAMEKAVNAQTKLVYICNPNNPTGTSLDTDKLRSFCERVSKKTMVFVDEAYIDYLPNPKAASMVDCVKKGQNVVVARTFSKLYGFAGLRVGYAITAPGFSEKLEPYYSGMWCMSGVAVQAALAAYQDRTFLDNALQKTLASRDYLYTVLKGEGYSYIPSSGNFVMFPINMPGKRFTEEMMKRGVGLRSWEFNNKHWCRISIGRMDEMEAFAAAFKEIS